ncbi:MAG: hypothetical protein OIN88_16330 [Candidatus Methanoperedens sp.]|nr:hypothetical protein [Candidatus Methanoperedens sp.]
MPENGQESGTQSEQAAKKIGVYLCRCGGNISDEVDLQAVADSLKENKDVTVIIQDYLCSSQDNQHKGTGKLGTRERGYRFKSQRIDKRCDRPHEFH